MSNHHPNPTASHSQCEAVLERLMATPNSWVAMPELYRVSGSMAVHSRIADLRGRGHVIEHKNERAGRQIHSFYRLMVEVPA